MTRYVDATTNEKSFFSTLLGGRADLVLRHPHAGEVLTTQHTAEEARWYTVVLARKKRLSVEDLLLALDALPVSVIGRSVYSRSLSEARRRIAHRDPDDVDLLALALHFQIPVWSNDKDFEIARVEWYTTGQLLTKLGIASK